MVLLVVVVVVGNDDADDGVAVVTPDLDHDWELDDGEDFIFFLPLDLRARRLAARFSSRSIRSNSSL